MSARGVENVAGGAAGCALCTQLESHPAPRAAGRLRLDHAALRRALGGELVEHAELRAAGRPSANVGVIWRYFTTSVYTSGDLPLVATREALQNSLDAVRAAIRARQIRAGEGRFAVTWDADTRALTWEDNGIGMDADTILGKFLSLGESGKADAASSDEAAGGFGVAKAVILGVSRSFRWEMHSRDNLAVARGADAEVQVFEAAHRQGTRITVHDLDPDSVLQWDYTERRTVEIAERLRQLLGANDLPELSITLNGEPVPALFSRRGGAKVPVEGFPRHVEARLKAYRRPPGDRRGAWYIRLNGLLQFRTPSRRANLKADMVLDLSTRIRPGQPGYPLNAARDSLQGATGGAFSELVQEVERENESSTRQDEDEVFDPGSADPEARAGADALGAQLADAFADEAVQRALGEAAGGLRAFYAAQAPRRPEPVGSHAAPGSPAPADAPARMALAGQEGAHPAQAVAQLLQAGGGRVPLEVQAALEALAEGVGTAEDAALLEDAIGRAVEGAAGPGGGGLMQVAAVPRVLAALDQAIGQPRARRLNPFGSFAGLRISRLHYDRARARRFMRSYARWVPHLLVWDGTLRLVAHEAGIGRAFKPGFVLNDKLRGLVAKPPSGAPVVYLNPDGLAEVVRAHRQRPLAVAAFLHGLAVHELAHLDGRMGQGHDEEFVSAREDLGASTAHLLPAIAALASRLLDLQPPADPDAERAERLAAENERLRRQLQDARAAGRSLRRQQERAQEQAQSEAILHAALAALRAAPPPGLTLADIDAFAARNRPALLRLVQRAFGGARGPRRAR